MLRPLGIMAGLSCTLLALGVVANAVAIRRAFPLASSFATHARTPERGPRLVVKPRATGQARSSESASPLVEQLRTRADRATREALVTNLGPLEPLVDSSQNARARLTVSSELLFASPERDVFVTRTEVRVPCQDLDRLLAQLDQPGLGRPNHCERWVEATAALLERYGVEQLSAREFLEQYGGDQTVRVLWFYAGWRPRTEAGQPSAELITTRATRVYPQSNFMSRRRAALNSVYEQLELGPYRRESTESRSG